MTRMPYLPSYNDNNEIFSFYRENYQFLIKYTLNRQFQGGGAYKSYRIIFQNVSPP
jgi:hypothetical protein